MYVFGNNDDSVFEVNLSMLGFVDVDSCWMIVCEAVIYFFDIFALFIFLFLLSQDLFLIFQFNASAAFFLMLSLLNIFYYFTLIAIHAVKFIFYSNSC